MTELITAVDTDELADIFGLPEEASWQERALCSQTDPEAFFPEKGGSTREAKRICTGCEVSSECLEYALEHDERFGIWGGLSERERRRLKRAPSDRPLDRQRRMIGPVCDDLERAPGRPLQLIQVVVVPAARRRAGDEPVRRRCRRRTSRTSSGSAGSTSAAP